MKRPSTSFILWSAGIAVVVGLATPWIRKKLFGSSSNGQSTPE
jgi:hypothetical protein